MNKPKYQYKSEDQFFHFEFVSEGPKGSIKKLVEYSPTGTENVYNLSFGDFDEEFNRINDSSITNNGDSGKVLATVASTVYAFINKYPKAWVFATGSNAVRTRLYRIGITNNLADISLDFAVLGYTENGIWEEFIKDRVYEAFLITKKENIFTA